MVIQITIADKRATVVDKPVIVCGNSDYTIKFTFDAEWNEHSTKTARFVYIQGNETKYQDVEFTGTTVAVPVMSNIKEVRVGVFAGSQLASTPAVIPCEPSIRCNADSQ